MTKKIKVMHILHTLGSGGLEKGVVNLTNYLNSRDFEVSICCLEKSGIFEHRLNNGTEVFVMSKPPGVDYKLPLRLAKLFRHEKTMIVHTHDLGTYFYGALGGKLALAPIIVHGEHGSLLQTSENDKRYMFAIRCLSHITDSIHTVSADLKNALARMSKVRDGKITTILNGVELEKFKISQNTKLRESFGINSHELVIGTVSRLVPVKNFELLIKVIPLVNQAGIRSKLIFVGDGPSRQNLESLTKQHDLENQVLFLGDRSDVPDILNAMDIFVLTSFSEGMSNSIMEAMASGLPVIASNVGGNPELVIHNKTGFLFPSRDIVALSKHIIELARNSEKRQKMGLAGRKRMEEKFSLEKMLKNYELLYRNILGSRYTNFHYNI